MSESEWVSLCFVADMTMGQSPDSIFVNNQEIGLPFLQGCAEFGAIHPLPKVYCNPPLRIAKNNSILISVRAPVGTTNFSDQDYCIGRGLAAIKAKFGLAETMYLKYVIENNISFLHRRSQGSTFLAISSADLNAFKIPNLQINKQKKIAAILTSIDTAIEKTESLIAKYQKIKAGLMHDLFTRGVTADGKLRPPREQAPELYQETPIGWIPMDWQCEQLQIVLSKSGGYLQTGPFGSQLHADEYTSEGTPVVMPQDINNEMIELNSIARIPEQRTNMLSRHRLKVGDITIARRGDLSRAAAVSEREANWICGTGCFLLRLGRTDLNHFFFSHAYRYDSIQRQIAGIAVGSTMPSLNNSVMSKLFFPVPRPFEQEAISQRLDAIACKITSEQNKLEKLKKQKTGLMQDLLTGKVPVKIDESDQEFA